MKKNFTQLPPHIQARFEEMGVNPSEKTRVMVNGLIEKVFTIGHLKSLSAPLKTREPRYTIVEDNTTIAALKNLFATHGEEKPGKIVVTRRSLSLQEIDLFLVNHPKYAEYKDEKENRYTFAEVDDESGKHIDIVRGSNEFESYFQGSSLVGISIYEDGTEKKRNG